MKRIVIPDRESQFLHSLMKNRTAEAEKAADLINAGADVNYMASDDTTPLMQAVEAKNTACVRLLLDRGADPNKKNKNGVTALFNTTNTDMIRTLIAAGATGDVININGLSLLMTYSLLNAYEPVALLLEKSTATIDHKSQSGECAIVIAAELQYYRLLYTLAAYGADPFSKNAERLTPRAIVEAELSASADFYARNAAMHNMAIASLDQLKISEQRVIGQTAQNILTPVSITGTHPRPVFKRRAP